MNDIFIKFDSISIYCHFLTILLIFLKFENFENLVIWGLKKILNNFIKFENLTSLIF